MPAASPAMMTRTLLPLLATLLAALAALPAQDPPPGSPPPNHVVRTALQWMQSGDPDRRQAAYRSVHLLGKDAIPAFEKTLLQALSYHEKRLAETLGGRRSRNNPYPEFTTVAADLAAERERVGELIRTDWHKDPEKIRVLRSEFATVEDLYEKAARLAALDTSAIDQQIDSITAALVEIHDQLQRFDGDSPAPSDPLTADERKRQALEESFDGHTYLQTSASLADFRAEIQLLASADQDNDHAAWANSAQKSFVQHLNHARAVMGLGPFRLDEKLSAAATGHSRDMKTLGFFSHTSPVDGKHSPPDRARKAGFQGRWNGENIFMGSASPVAAYNAWFASDGHRFIMFADSPNLAGVGPVGSHWTLMTGKR